MSKFFGYEIILLHRKLKKIKKEKQKKLFYDFYS